MKKRYFITSFIILVLVVVVTTFFAFAYFFDQDSKEFEEEIGSVGINAFIYFKDGANEIPPTEIITIDNIKKPNVYEVNVSNQNSAYFITKLRVDFLVNSNVETIFRVRLIDTLTLTVNTPAGLQELSMPNVGIPYVLGANWYFDQNTNWYYYTETVKSVDSSTLVIPFIIEGLNFDLMSTQNRIQFGIKIEAVQADKGPENNWIDWTGFGGWLNEKSNQFSFNTFNSFLIS